jgi:hypothetical protein
VKCREQVIRILGRAGAHETDHRHRRLLRPRYDRPRQRSAAEPRDDIPPSKMIEPHLPATG